MKTRSRILTELHYCKVESNILIGKQWKNAIMYVMEVETENTYTYVWIEYCPFCGVKL